MLNLNRQHTVHPGNPLPGQHNKEKPMYNVNYMLAKALQRDHLREAKINRVSRLWDMRRRIRKAQKAVK